MPENLQKNRAAKAEPKFTDSYKTYINQWKKRLRKLLIA